MRALRTPHRSLRVLACVCATLAACALGAARPPLAAASATQAQILEDDGALLSNPGGAVLEARELGFTTIRVMMYWSTVAPAANSFHKPAHFVASDPADYPATNWAPYDALVRVASASGIRVDIDLMGGAPLWATGPQMPHDGGYPHHSWDPSPSEYGAFVKAVGTRYGGRFDPATGTLRPGSTADLPRVSFWSLWNEPDYGPSLSPQAVPGSASVPEAPRLLRALLSHGWAALAASGHRAGRGGSDTIIWGELAPRGTPTFGNFNGMLPIPFLQALYCAGPGDQPLRGGAAALLGCPTTRAGSARFAAQNPALFQASGVSVHPYMRWYAPNDEQYYPRLPGVSLGAWRSEYLANYTTLAVIGHLTSTLDRLVGAYGSHERFPIWNTEFGYITSPPKHPTRQAPYASLATAAYYDNWAEYISYRNPRIASFDQYLLQDPIDPTAATDWGGYTSGLVTYFGAHKPGFDAFRMPLFLPQTAAASSGSRLLVWGAVKPAAYARTDVPAAPETVTLRFRPRGSSAYRTLATVPVTGAGGYYQVRLAFPSSGTLVARWQPPADPLLGITGPASISSRSVQVTVR